MGVPTVTPPTTPVHQLPGSVPSGSDPAPGLRRADSGVGLNDVTVSSPQAAADQPQQLQQLQQLQQPQKIQQLQQLENTQNVNAFLAHLKQQQGITIPETSDPRLLPLGTANPFVDTPSTPDSIMMGSGWPSNAAAPSHYTAGGSSAGSDSNPSSAFGNPYLGLPHPFLYKGNPELLVTPEERLQLALKAAQKEGSDQANANRLPGSIASTGQSSLSSQTTTGASPATSTTSLSSSSTASSEATSKKSASSATGYGRVKEKVRKLLRFVFRKRPSETKSEVSKDASPGAPEAKADDSAKQPSVVRLVRRFFKWLRADDAVQG